MAGIARWRNKRAKKAGSGTSFDEPRRFWDGRSTSGGGTSPIAASSPTSSRLVSHRVSPATESSGNQGLATPVEEMVGQYNDRALTRKLRRTVYGTDGNCAENATMWMSQESRSVERSVNSGGHDLEKNRRERGWAQDTRLGHWALTTPIRPEERASTT